MRFKQILETTTAGSVATVAQPMMTQTRENTNVKGLKPVQQVMKGAKKKGPYANSITESKVKELTMDLKELTTAEFQKKYGKTKAEIKTSMTAVNEDDLAEQDLIVIPGQGRLRRTGFVKHDLDQGEHEGHTLKNSLHTIARAASDLDKRLSVQSEFPEWVSEKIGAAKGMMVSVMDYLISSQEMQHDSDAMNEGSQRVDSLVTDALKVMKGPEVSDAVLALKRVLGDRAYNERRGFYSFYVDQIHRNWQLPMYGQQDLSEGDVSTGNLQTMYNLARMAKNYCSDPEGTEALTELLRILKWYMDQGSEQSVTEGWKDEADDFTGWSNHVKEKLSKAAPEQRLGIAKQLSQIEVKNFGSTIQGGFNRQTGKAQPGLGLTDTVRNIFKSFSQEQQDINAYNTKDEDGKAGTPDAGKFQTKFGSIFVYGMENATPIELVLMGKAVRMGPDYSKAAQEIYRKTGTLTVDDLKGIRKGFEDNANKFATSIGAQIEPSNRPEEPTALTQASLAQQDQRLRENSTLAAGVDAKGRTAQEWVKLVKAKYPDAKIMQSKMPNGPWAAKLSDGRTTYWEPAEQDVAEGEKDTSRMNQQHQDFYNKNPNFKRDDREVKSIGGRLATKVTPKTAQVTKKPMTPFEGKIDFAKKLQGKVDKHNKAVVKTKKDIGSRIADIGDGGKEHNVKTDAAWDAAKKKVAESYKKK
jgi:hypothetical protein